MKYLSEYRNLEDTKKYLDLIAKTATKTWNIMEICGGQTHGLVKCTNDPWSRLSGMCYPAQLD